MFSVAIYIISGEVEDVGQAQTFGEAELIVLKPGAEIVLRAPFHSARLMLMGGEPFSEPRGRALLKPLDLVLSKGPAAEMIIYEPQK